jgi:hypothetical protein
MLGGAEVPEVARMKIGGEDEVWFERSVRLLCSSAVGVCDIL